MGALPTERIASRSRSTHSQAADFGRRQERRRRESLGSLCPSLVFMPQNAFAKHRAAPGCVFEDDPSAAQAAHSLNYSGTASLTSAGPSGSTSWRATNTHMACSRRSVGSQARTSGDTPERWRTRRHGRRAVRPLQNDSAAPTSHWVTRVAADSARSCG